MWSRGSRSCSSALGNVWLRASDAIKASFRPFSSSNVPLNGSVKLYYWPVQGSVEPIRMCLAYSGVKWEEPEVPFMSYWRDRELYPFGQLPRYEEATPEPISIVQSQAILRHVGRKYNMNGRSMLDKAFVDMLVGACFDLRRKFKRFAGLERPGTSCQLDSKWKYVNTVLAQDPFQSQGASMVSFEHIVAKRCQEAGRPFVLGDRPSTADMFMAYIYDIHEQEFGNYLPTRFPHLRQLRDRTFALPQLAGYLRDHRPGHLWAPEWLAAEKQLDPVMLPQIAQHVIECS